MSKESTNLNNTGWWRDIMTAPHNEIILISYNSLAIEANYRTDYKDPEKNRQWYFVNRVDPVKITDKTKIHGWMPIPIPLKMAKEYINMFGIIPYKEE